MHLTRLLDLKVLTTRCPVELILRTSAPRLTSALLTFGLILSCLPWHTAAAKEPTPGEQYFLELLNRARANPEAEAGRYNITLNEGSPNPPISATSKPPLAFNTKVMEAASNHLSWMNSGHGAFNHTASGTIGQHSFTGAQPSDRLAYTSQTYVTWRENLAVTSKPQGKAAIDQMYELLFKDTTVPGRLHRVNILLDPLTDIGLAIGDVSKLKLPGISTGVVQLFIQDSVSSAKLTGVAIDDKDGDQFYTIGEGLDDVDVEIVGTNLKAKTWASGGYTLDISSLADGEHQVRFTRAGKIFEQSFTRSGHRNVKVDAMATAFIDPPVVVDPPVVYPPVVNPPVVAPDYALGAYWEFDDIHQATAKGIAADSVGSSQGLLNGAVLSADSQGRTGQPGDRALDTSGGGLIVSGEKEMQILNRAQAIDKVTFSFWQKLKRITDSGVLYAFADETGQASAAEVNAPWGDGNLYFSTNGCCDEATQNIFGPPPSGHDFTDWHHYAFVKDGPHKSIWIDGVKVLEGQNTAPLPKNFTDLLIGVDYGSGTPDGFLDDLAIFASALPPEVIAQLAAGAKASQYLSSRKRPLIDRVVGGSHKVGLAFKGAVGKTYKVEFSSDLRTWTTIDSDLSGDINYEDTDASRIGKTTGYYRVIEE